MSLEPQGCPAPGACACIGENTNLIGIIARIRQLSGVGDKPDLADLPEAIAAKLKAARSGRAFSELTRQTLSDFMREVLEAVGDPPEDAGERVLWLERHDETLLWWLCGFATPGVLADAPVIPEGWRLLEIRQGACDSCRHHYVFSEEHCRAPGGPFADNGKVYRSGCASWDGAASAVAPFLTEAAVRADARRLALEEAVQAIPEGREECCGVTNGARCCENYESVIDPDEAARAIRALINKGGA